MPIHKTPIQRAIDTTMRLAGQVYRGTFYANDFGGSHHRIEGFFLDDAGGEHHFHGELFDIEFLPPKRGRPVGDAAPLDVGLTLCHRWHQRKGDAPQDRPAARRETLDWWHARGWPGASDESALSKRIRNGRKAIEEMSLQRFEPGDPGDVSTLIAVTKDATAFQVVNNAIHVSVNGAGWVWRSDRARAEFGRIRYVFTIEQASAATIASLRACQGR